MARDHWLQRERCWVNIYIDESGTFGHKDRYFVAACIITDEPKTLKNTMKKSLLRVKQEFPEFAHLPETKARDSYPPIKDYVLRKVSARDLQINYVVCDKKHILPDLLADQNRLYMSLAI